MAGIPSFHPSYIDQRQTEFDPTGGNVGTVSNYQPQYGTVNNDFPPVESESSLYINGGRVPCTLDGLTVSCTMAFGMLGNSADLDFARNDASLLGQLGISWREVWSTRDVSPDPNRPGSPNFTVQTIEQRFMGYEYFVNSVSWSQALRVRDYYEIIQTPQGGSSQPSPPKTCDDHREVVNGPAVKAALTAAWQKSKFGKQWSTPDTREQGGLLATRKGTVDWKAFEFTRSNDDFRMTGFGIWGSKLVKTNAAFDFQYFYHTHPYQKWETIEGDITMHPRLPSEDDHSVAKKSKLFGIIITPTEIVIYDNEQTLCTFGRN